MDGSEFVGVDGTFLVDGLSNNIDNSSQSLRADGHFNRIASVFHFLSTDETFGGVQGDSSHVGATQMLGNLKDESVLGSLDLEGVEDRGKLSLELHVHDGTNNLGHFSYQRSSGAEKSY